MPRLCANNCGAQKQGANAVNGLGYCSKVSCRTLEDGSVIALSAGDACVTCGGRASSRAKGADGFRYCSDKCRPRDVALSLPAGMKCVTCGGRASFRATGADGFRYCSDECRGPATDGVRAVARAAAYAASLSLSSGIKLPAVNGLTRADIISAIVSSTSVQHLLVANPQASIYIGGINIFIADFCRMSPEEVAAAVFAEDAGSLRSGGRGGTFNPLLRANSKGDFLGVTGARALGGSSLVVQATLDPSSGCERDLQLLSRVHCTTRAAILNGGNVASGNLPSRSGCVGVIALTVLPDREKTSCGVCG